MKKAVFIILLVVGALCAGLAAWIHREAPPSAAPQTAAVAPAPKPTSRTMIPAPVQPKPEPEPQMAQTKVEPATPVVQQPAKPRRPSQAEVRAAWIRHQQNAQKSFERHQERLEREENPRSRDQLIEALARHVRIDTPKAIEWAMGLEDPAERSAALEAVNKNALVGIGARIEMDDTGYPKIKNTTVLSAIESTGATAAGDYITGMVNADGSTTDFRGQPMRDIVGKLRGEPGTEVVLRMARPPENGGASAPYTVAVQRSLIVVEPMF